MEQNVGEEKKKSQWYKRRIEQNVDDMIYLISESRFKGEKLNIKSPNNIHVEILFIY